MSDYKKEEEKQSFFDKKEEKRPMVKNKKFSKIILVGKDYAVVDLNGFNQFISGKFAGKKIGDEIEVE